MKLHRVFPFSFPNKMKKINKKRLVRDKMRIKNADMRIIKYKRVKQHVKLNFVQLKKVFCMGKYRGI